MRWRNIGLIFRREVQDQLRDRRTLFMITILPLLLYPALGIGMMQSMMWFSEQPRTVVILGADELPDPPLLEGVYFAENWFEFLPNREKLRVVTDRPAVDSPPPADPAAGRSAPADSASTTAGPAETQATESPPTQVIGKETHAIKTAESLAALAWKLQRLQREQRLSEHKRHRQVPSPTEPQPSTAGPGTTATGASSSPVAVSTSQQVRTADDRDPIADLRHQLNTEFAESGIDVLLLMPEGFLADHQRRQRQLRDRSTKTDPQANDPQPIDAATEPLVPNDAVREAAADSLPRPRPLILHNGADERSLIAFRRVQMLLDRWEQAILQQELADAGLPRDLATPVHTEELDLAETEQLSASFWSKLFPALLVIMAVTGAFYPAIDLGAGEKERGTMETLLISPASRAEIVLGKFCTVMTFSMATALLNLFSIGFTGRYMASLSAAGAASRLGDLTPPPLAALVWVVVVLVPLSALFSALSLALATFARSSKEGQYYMTPLLMVTMGLTIFCLMPAVEMQPFYSVLPIVGPALLLRGLLQGGGDLTELGWYVIPVLSTSLIYSLIALWWAIDQFRREEVLFREAERFELRLWLQHLLQDKQPTPSFAHAFGCFVLIMLLQFWAMKSFQEPLTAATAEERPLIMVQLLMVQQLAIIATPALLMGILLTTSLRKTFSLRWPSLLGLVAAVLLPFCLHPLSLELGAALQGFFPPLPSSVMAQLKSLMSGNTLPLWLVLLTFAVAPAVCEELAFRGFILSGFSQTGRVGVAILLSSLTFGIMHQIPQQVFNASLVGLVLGLLAVSSRSLLPGVIFHLIYNALEVLRNRLGSVDTAAAGETTTTATTSLPSWLFRLEDGGLRYQPVLLVGCGLLAALLIAGLLRSVTTRTDDSELDSSEAAA